MSKFSPYPHKAAGEALRATGMPWWAGSERLTGKQERTRAKRDLRRGEEPQPAYFTGKQYND